MMTSPNEGFWSASPKAMFFMGLILGLAVSAVAALTLVLSFVWSGKTLAGGLKNNPSAVAAVPSNPSPTPSNDAFPTPPPAGPVKPVDANDHILGNKDAKVTLIEYSDFQCPFCERHVPSLQQALKDFPKDVRLVYRHYPLTTIHPNAQAAGEAAECAAKLGGNSGFWKLHDKMFDKSPELSNDVLISLAKEIGLNESAFKTCLTSGEMKARVDNDAAEGDAAGVRGTPATFINGKLVSGAVPYANLKAEITAAGGKE